MTQPRSPAPQPDLRSVPWPTFLGYFLGLGTWGFGGPIATVGYLQRDLGAAAGLALHWPW